MGCSSMKPGASVAAWIVVVVAISAPGHSGSKQNLYRPLLTISSHRLAGVHLPETP